MKSQSKLIVAGISLLVLVLPFVLISLNETVKEYSDALDIYLVFVLILVTMCYTFFAHQIISEAQKDRSLNVRPALIPSNVIIRDDNAWEGEFSCTTIDLKNVGNGAAFAIKVLLIDPETRLELASSKNDIDYLTADGETDDDHIHIPNKKLQQLKFVERDGGMVAYIVVQLQYSDIFNKSYISERTFTVKNGDKVFKQTVGSFKLNALN